MSMGLTARQRAAFDFIAAYIARHRVPPSFSEMCDHLGCSSKSSVHRLMAALKERGCIDFIPKRARSITLVEQDAATALSGSGPAYVYYLVESMVDAGILLGMARGTALEMVIQAVYGAATMLRESGEHPVILREAVTSPGGTTISAIRELEKHGVRAAFLAAIEAARDRGRELGAQ